MKGVDSGRAAGPDRPLEVLVLYSMRANHPQRNSLSRHVFCFRTHPHGENVRYLNVVDGLPREYLRLSWDAIFIDVTVLCARWADEATRRRVGDMLSSLRSHPAVKVAFPQDEYDRSSTLDQWLVASGTSLLYSVCPDHRAELFPTYLSRGAVLPALTGYIEDGDIPADRVPLRRRKIDVGYRAKKLPARFGRVGLNKTVLAERFAKEAKAAGFRCDVSCRPEDVLLGDSWAAFLGDCRFTFGTNSGSSLIDADGSIALLEERFKARFPEATFEEIEAFAFPGLDGKHTITAISPRVFEAALHGSCQILVRGKYGGLLEPWDDYIPLEEDFSNLGEVLGCMRDLDRAQAIADHCFANLTGKAELRYAGHTRAVFSAVREEISAREGEPRPRRGVSDASVAGIERRVARREVIIRPVARRMKSVRAAIFRAWKKTFRHGARSR